MNNQNYIIDIINLKKKYILKNNDNVEIINNLNLKIRSNCKVSIVGPSGSGKTSLLNIIGLLDKNFEGTYYFKELNTFSLSEKKTNEIRGSSIGFIHQFFHLIPELSVIENVMLPILIDNNKLAADKIASSILNEFGLEDRINYKPLKLSGGEQQRVAIARALVNNPNLILADEMTGNLDENTANKIFDFFLNYVEKNKKTLVYVTHNKKFSLFADEIYHFKNKKLTLADE